MGLTTIPGVAMKVAKCVTITPLTALLTHLNHILFTALAGVGLLRRPFQGEFMDEDDDAVSSLDASNFVLIMDGVTPSLVHVHVLMGQIKLRLPVVRHRGAAEGEEEEETVCSVCLSGVEEGDEVRELNNCGHVFHRECLDCWVDGGHATCPLCRTLLFPPQKRGGRGGTLVWRSENERLIGAR